MSLWAKEGLDLTDSAFNKLHSKESRYEDKREKFDLQPETFRKFAKNLIDKVIRMHATNEFTVIITKPGGNVTKNVLKEYSTIQSTEMTTNRDERWPATAPLHSTQSEQDKFTDSLIKASVVGNYIHDSLTEDAREQLEAESDFFKVLDEDGASHYDGPSYFYAIARLVDPDNGHLVAGVKRQLRSLDVKNYNYDVKKMLSDFKNLSTRVVDLGGTLSTDDQLLNLWSACSTMKEKEFTRFVGELEDREAEKDPSARDSINELIRKICAKQTRMETKNTWNSMSQEDIMLMSLVGLLENKSSKKKGSLKSKNRSSSKSVKEKNAPASSASQTGSKDAKIPEWKKVPPTKDEPNEKVIGNRTFYWCAKCRNGTGMWAMHKQHDDNFKAIQCKTGLDSGTTLNNKDTKKVSFNVSSECDKEDSDVDDAPQITVRDDLLHNAKTYLSQFSDFQKGGTQG